MKLKLTIVVLVSVVLIGLGPRVGLGQVYAASPHTQAAAPAQSQTARFDKTRFLAHLAASAFLVHYVYSKYKRGMLGRHHLVPTVKAAVAAALAYHELKTAYDVAKTSNSRILRLIVFPLSALTGTVNSMSGKLRQGDTSLVAVANSRENVLQSAAAKVGYGFKDARPSSFAGF